ncbi:hypothetical protein C8F04DRAFT_590976 [Mycena alexandri]|uniref:Uncharacterized protein n=1 Tax=Mycena alexandri TaxID=1745969 RepID=A0AAD6XDR1_9AGAR|nr:hypothetical protein C8F04DRAFT_590976 [Mycena alexandri]
MFSIVRKMLAIGNVLATARDCEPNAPTTHPKTRQRTRSRRSRASTVKDSLKGVPTCHGHTLLVTVTAAPHIHDVLAAATCIRDPAVIPVFVLKHITIEQNVLAITESKPYGAQNIAVPQRVNASERVAEPSGPRSCEADVEAEVDVEVWRDENDVDAEILQKPNSHQKCTAINVMTIQTINFIKVLYQDPSTIVWAPERPGVPFIALTPADETWEEFACRCSNQPGQQFDPYLHVPFDDSSAAFSPFGPTDAPSNDGEEPIQVFSPSRFAASVCLSLKEHAPYQALFAQKHAYKAVAYVASLVGATVRAYYDEPAVCEHLEELYVFTWSDPATPLLEMWRNCFMITIHESEHPFAGVPHIVVNGTLPNAPWDTELVVLPIQDEEYLTVPLWSYMEPAEALEEEEEAEDAWYRDSEEEEQGVQYRSITVSESEDELEEARTPSPPSWSMLAFPSSTVRSSTRLEDVCEEDENASSVPPVTETRIRKPWLQDNDEHKEDSPSSVSSTPPAASNARPPPAFSARFSFNAPLSEIGEASREAAYQPLSPSYIPLWSSEALLAASSSANMDDDARTIHTMRTEFDSSDDRSVYTDALEEQPPDEEDNDENDTASEYGHHARTVPRPSCDIFLDDGDDDVSYRAPPAPRPRGKANIPAGKIDWFDLPDDDLGELDWEMPSNSDAEDGDEEDEDT